MFSGFQRFFVLLAGFSLLAGCGGEDPLSAVNVLQSSITNGKPTSDYPTVGEISGCTATLVGKKTVLTAAHCVWTGGSYSFKVAGSKYSGKAVRHPSYGGFNLSNDIALIRLTQAPPVTPTPISNAAPAVGDEVVLVGFGVTSEYGKDGGIKRMAKNTIAKVTKTTIVFYGSGGDIGNTCYGDSGGPAFSTINGHFVVVGVTSRGDYCGKDGVDTRVDTFRDWVMQASNNDALEAGAKPADSEPPKVTILSPQAGETLAPGQHEVKVEATDNVGVVKVQLAVETEQIGEVTAPPYDFPVELEVGTHSLHVRALDDQGNAGQASVTVKVTDLPPIEPAPSPTDPIQPTEPESPSEPTLPQADNPHEATLYGGCNVAGSPGQALPTLSVLLIALYWLVRRHRAR
jgi:hypothetical protein